MIGNALDAIDLWLTRLIRVVTVLVTLILVASLLIGVVYRYGLQDATSWTDEVALLGFTWLVFLTAALCVQDDTHVRIELLDRVLPSWAHRFLRQVIWIAVAAVGGFMIWTGVNFLDFTVGQTSPAIRYPVWLRDSAFPLSGALIVFYALRQLRRKSA